MHVRAAKQNILCSLHARKGLLGMCCAGQMQLKVRTGLLCLWLLCGFNLTYINM